jgi:DNA-binding XRE family transcriptional regulator
MVARVPLRPVQTDGVAFGPMLRRLRTRSGLSQNQLARRSGVDPAYVNRLERAVAATGQASVSLPSRKVVTALWEALEAAVEDRERLLVAAGHCPETILLAGGWDAYIGSVRRQVVAALDALDVALTVPPDTTWER